LICASIRHIVEAWEESATGDRTPLQLAASQSAATALLHPTVENRTAKLSLRDAALERWEPAGLELGAVPPRVSVEIEVSAVRSLWSQAAVHIGGSVDRRRAIRMTWTLELTDCGQPPWRLVASTSPAGGIPHA